MFGKNNKKGQIGLNLLLQVIAMVFVIGILVMSFVFIGARIRNSTALFHTQNGAYTNSTVTSVIYGVPEALSAYSLTDVACALGSVYNGSGGKLIPSSNYSESSECYINYTDALSGFNNTNWLVSYTYTYSGFDADSGLVINNTIDSIAESTSFFSIIIIIAGVIVLILLIVVIINSLRGSGLMGQGGA